HSPQMINITLFCHIKENNPSQRKPLGLSLEEYIQPKGGHKQFFDNFPIKAGRP
ncbi:10718_t:CDS:1, partial [Funneliformis geosporum]